MASKTKVKTTDKIEKELKHVIRNCKSFEEIVDRTARYIRKFYVPKKKN